ncbi:C39 family peptidase [Paenibacillus sp. MB22_1]|uniref:C39 family peptidase n=1 Tax=Paenibacillus sp. MB22_1 TaxID=3383121 RepID=UPI00207E083F|nr:hypothetical protein HMSSN139_07350 [Paenibacillus sp. HMSSN-139]
MLNQLIKEREEAAQQSAPIKVPVPSNRTNGEVGVSTIINYEYDLISGVPDYQQNDNDSMENDCVPTTGAAIIMYYDAHGYPNLSSSSDWKQVANRLGVLMDHDDSYGVYSSNVKPGFNDYISEKGYSGDFTVTRDTSVSFSDIKNEVSSDSPAFLRVVGYDYNDPTGADGGHMITLVGYETYTDTEDWSTPQYALVQDNWETTGKTVYLLMGQFGSMTDIWKVRD